MISLKIADAVTKMKYSRHISREPKCRCMCPSLLCRYAILEVNGVRSTEMEPNIAQTQIAEYLTSISYGCTVMIELWMDISANIKDDFVLDL